MQDQRQVNEIVVACKQGDQEAFSRLVDLYSKRCYGFFYRLTGNTDQSSDLLSDLFVKLVEGIGAFKGGSFDKWIFTVASNIFKDHLRSRYRQKRLLLSKSESLREQQSANCTGRAESEMADRLQRQLAKLDADTAELIVLRFYSQLSFRELAQMRAEPIGTTLSKVHRGLQKLKQLMETPDD